MKCPYCDYDRVTTELRCPNCQEALTLWRNFDMYGKLHFDAGSRLMESAPQLAAEELLKAVVFAPDQVEYLVAYAGLLCRLGRHSEAAALIARAEPLAPGCTAHLKADMPDTLPTASPGAQRQQSGGGWGSTSAGAGADGA